MTKESSRFTTAGGAGRSMIPLLAAAALAIRLAACTSSDGAAAAGAAGAAGGGGCSGRGEGKVSPPVCEQGKPGTVRYEAVDACDRVLTQKHDCPGNCVFVSAYSVKCESGAPGEAPFQTCSVATDCGTSRYCVDAKNARLLDSPVCNDGVCDWQMGRTESCTAQCATTVGACAFQGAAGSTSGSFPGNVMKGVCDGDNLVYFTVEGSSYQSGSVKCASGCAIDATGAACNPAVDEPPQHTCTSLSDCPASVARCQSGDPGSKTIYQAQGCPKGLCVWVQSTVSACPSGTTCTGSPCGG